jgi:hypothetical protein
MNVHTDGELIPLIALPKLLREKLGRSPDKRTIKRWRKEGLCGGKVVLETTRRGLHWYTTKEWLDEFFKKQEDYRKQSEAYVAQLQANFRRTSQRRSSRQANREHEEAMERLKKIYPNL